MLIVYWPVTKKFRIYASRPQDLKLITVAICGFISYLAPYWLLSRNTTTFHKYFWCSWFCEFRSKRMRSQSLHDQWRFHRASHPTFLIHAFIRANWNGTWFRLCFLPQMSKYLSLGARPPFGVLQINPCFSLSHRRSLTPVNTVCEAAPRSLSLSPIGLNELPKVSFGFPCNLIGKSTIGFFFHAKHDAYSNPSTHMGSRTWISALACRGL